MGQFPQVNDPLVFLHSTGGFVEHVCLFSLHSSTSFVQAGLCPPSTVVQPFIKTRQYLRYYEHGLGQPSVSVTVWHWPDCKCTCNRPSTVDWCTRRCRRAPSTLHRCNRSSFSCSANRTSSPRTRTRNFQACSCIPLRFDTLSPCEENVHIRLRPVRIIYPAQ